MHKAQSTKHKAQSTELKNNFKTTFFVSTFYNFGNE